MTRRYGPGRAQRQRAGAVRAAGRGPAVGARHRGQVAAPGHLDQHRRVGLDRGPGRLPGQAGQPGGRRPRVPGELRVVAGRQHLRGTRPHRLPGGHDLPRPAGLDQQLGLSRAGVPADQYGGSAEPRPGQQHVAGVRVRRARLGVQVVPVVPDGDQSEPVDRGEHGRPGPDHHRHRTPAGGQERAVALRRPQRRGERDVPPGAGQRGQRGVEPVQVPGIGYHGHRATPGPGGRGQRLGEPGRPVLAGQRRPDRPRGPTRGERPQEARSVRVAVPAGRRRAAGPVRCGRVAGPIGSDPLRGRVSISRGGGRRFSLRRRLPLGPGSLSTRACRGGTASRSTSARLPA